MRVWNGAEAGARVDEFLEDPVGRLFGDLFYLDPPFLARHQHGTFRRAIEHEAQVQLSLDLQALFDEHALDDLTRGAGLDA